ncbi:MAG: hypothetical protein JWM33_2910, partial [Caulobacteraceae bacterium]|nr:hypothetical protein [Caulobacteraceae bacterium]
AAQAQAARAPAAAAPRPAAAPRAGEIGPGNYAPNMAAMIAADAAASKPATLKTGTYECRVGGQYTFMDLIIRSATTYSISTGGGGNFRYSDGALTFTSGSFAGAYSRMVDGKTIGISTDHSTNLGTQCELTN